MKEFSVNIVGLSNKAHQFDFSFGDEFFKEYGQSLMEGGSFKASVTLDKHETFIEANFKIEGKAQLICDRSLEPFDHPMNIDRKIIFKYGEEEKELSDEIVIIPRDKDSLDLGQFMYEFIGLAIPLKKVHPRFQEEEDETTEGKLVYTSTPNETTGDIDPRWEKLKKLK